MVKETMTPRERIEAAINLQPTDRVPVMPLVDVLFPCRYKGIALSEGVRNLDLGRQAIMEVFDEVGGWDGMILAGFSMVLVPTLAAALQVPRRILPGRELPENYIPQYDERELLTAEDYDAIADLGWRGFAEKCRQRLDPRPPERIIAWAEKQTEQYVRDIRAWEERGVPCLVGAMVDSPLMFFSVKRTLTQFTFDLYRRPDRVAAAMDAVVDEFIEDAIATTKITGLPCVMLVLERGGGFYYPLKIFERFEFPYLKRMVEAFAAEGIRSLLHFDQDWTINLPYLRELPRGMCICEVDSTTDIFKAKEILQGHMCIMGDVPASLQAVGTPQEVEAYCRKLIDVVGRGGGFILSSGCSVPVDTRFENFKAMVDTAKSYPAPK